MAAVRISPSKLTSSRPFVPWYSAPSTSLCRFVPCYSTNAAVSHAVSSAKDELLHLYKYLQSKGASIEVALSEAMAEFHKREPPKELETAMKYCTQAEGGRHVSTLCIAACELVGGKESQALGMACVVELWMAVLLTMDDLPCMDDAKLRKGQPAAHVQFGETTALLATYALLLLAFEYMVSSSRIDCGVNHSRRLLLMKEFSRVCERLIWGQFEDMKLDNKTATLEDVQRKNTNKTSSFFELSLVTGAILGGASEQQVEGLRNYGRYFGLMYQVNDDISDAHMSSEEMGKDAKLDAKHEKPTCLSILGMEGCVELRDELATKAKQELLRSFPPENARVLLAIVEATRRFGSIYNNSQLLQKANL